VVNEIHGDFTIICWSFPVVNGSRVGVWAYRHVGDAGDRGWAFS